MKLQCPVAVHIREICRFPDFAVCFPFGGYSIRLPFATLLFHFEIVQKEHMIVNKTIAGLPVIEKVQLVDIYS